MIPRQHEPRSVFDSWLFSTHVFVLLPTNRTMSAIFDKWKYCHSTEETVLDLVDMASVAFIAVLLLPLPPWSECAGYELAIGKCSGCVPSNLNQIDAPCQNWTNETQMKEIVLTVSGRWVDFLFALNFECEANTCAIMCTFPYYIIC